MGFRGIGFSPIFSLLKPTFSLLARPYLFAKILLSDQNAPLPLIKLVPRLLRGVGRPQPLGVGVAAWLGPSDIASSVSNKFTASADNLVPFIFGAETLDQ